ncbi:MAG TPA: hypothetical protein DCX41_00905 [Aequorivita sp.]|nr:hypothetical protein [Aequorivita sp.]HBL79214.1 hypothetical protein [Aequorivita sp.]
MANVAIGRNERHCLCGRFGRLSIFEIDENIPIMQTLLVLITFVCAICFLITRFVWNPFQTEKKRNKPGDHSDCSKCSFH